MTAAKKTTTKPTAKTTIKAPAKKLTMSLKTGKIVVKPAAKKATSTVDQILKNQGPIIVKASETKAGPKIAAKTTKAPKADKGPSKMDEAIKVWNSMPKAQRKDVIAAFIDKAKLTKAGANTYYSLIKAKKAK